MHALQYELVGLLNYFTFAAIGVVKAEKDGKVYPPMRPVLQDAEVDMKVRDKSGY